MIDIVDINFIDMTDFIAMRHSDLNTERTNSKLSLSTLFAEEVRTKLDVFLISYVYLPMSAPRFGALCPCSSPLQSIRQVIAQLRVTALKLVIRSTPLFRSILKFSASAPERSWTIFKIVKILSEFLVCSATYLGFWEVLFNILVNFTQIWNFWLLLNGIFGSKLFCFNSGALWGT